MSVKKVRKVSKKDVHKISVRIPSTKAKKRIFIFSMLRGNIRIQVEADEQMLEKGGIDLSSLDDHLPPNKSGVFTIFPIFTSVKSPKLLSEEPKN